MKRVMTGVAVALLAAACAQSPAPQAAPQEAAQETAQAAPSAVERAVQDTQAKEESVTVANGLNPAAQAYLDAVNGANLDALVAAFTPNAEINDVSRAISGHDAIRVWADNEVIGGSLRILSIVEKRADGQKLLVHWSPAGTDGFRAYYDFDMTGGKITGADLQYA